MRKKAEALIDRLGDVQSAIIYCQLRAYKKDLFQNEVDQWNKIKKVLEEWK